MFSNLHRELIPQASPLLGSFLNQDTHAKLLWKVLA